MLRFIFNLLASADPPAHADAIFVLAGLKTRKVFAIRLLEQGVGPCILFSVGRFEIRRFPELGLPQTIDLLQMAQSIPPPQRHYFVLFENQQFSVQRIPVRMLGTLSEIDALADWLGARPQISSLLIVSSGPHLRRLRICCRILLPRNIKTSFLAAPEQSATRDPRIWWSDAATRKMVLTECFKIACYLVFLPFWKLARPWRSKTISSIAPN
jgi:uncharacterized SAM-binding protein YcdF (DUF218 family)